VLAGQGLIGNPSSAHSAGLAAAEALSAARGSVASLFGVEADEVVLTSGGSESNAMALLGTFAARGSPGI
jgi:cysteine desulfurase